jgi:NADPH2:quinone reductase
MRAAVIAKQGDDPKVQDFHEPAPADDAVLIDVTTAGLGAWDILGAYREATGYPCVIRGEGVGRAEDGRRVYFGERSVLPYGAWAERTLVPAAEVWDVPDDVDDRTAISMGIAGTGALAPLEEARIKPGESVLILGASGGLGQIALQLARILGAGRVVGAARDRGALERLMERGIADGIVQLGSDDDAAALLREGGDGYDVVLDIVYGEPFVSALKATRWGARVMSIGAQAGHTANVGLRDMLFRTHSCVGTGQRSAQERRSIWERLLVLSREHGIGLDYRDFTLETATEAWQEQSAGPHAKIIGSISNV